MHLELQAKYKTIFPKLLCVYYNMNAFIQYLCLKLSNIKKQIIKALLLLCLSENIYNMHVPFEQLKL